MEDLLNNLIKKGWKPRDIETLYIEVKHGTIHLILPQMGNLWKPIRLLTSKESGLWQFVYENRMTKKMEKVPRGIWINSWSKSAYEKSPVYTMEKAEYRIIESALCDEEDLEKFLIDNIKV